MPYCLYFVHVYPTCNSTSYFWNLTLEYQIESNFLRIQDLALRSGWRRLVKMDLKIVTNNYNYVKL